MATALNSSLLKEMNRLNMNVLDARYARLDASWNLRFCSSFTRVYLVTEGMGRLRWAGGEVTMRPGCIYLVPAGLEFSTACPERMEKLYFHINILRYNKYDLFEGHPNIITLTDCQEVIGAARRQIEQDDIHSAFALKLLLWETVSRAVAQEGIAWGGIEVYSRRIKMVMQQVESAVRASLDGDEPLGRRLSIEEISAKTHYTPAALQKEFRAQVGMPLRRYINDRILVAAEHELRTGNRSLHDISNRLGFCDQFYFSRCFSARYGLSPREYRQNRT